MAVVINEVVTEVVLQPDAAAASSTPQAAMADDETVDLVVRRAAERVLEILRREWEV